ncbi:MAG: hypothetical protein O3A85_02940 [Proteobacteria bacterium]|nr:hypothetical protein [Pseudomonadota bacterium]
MRVQPKSFYADLFSREAATKAMSPLPSALASPVADQHKVKSTLPAVVKPATVIKEEAAVDPQAMVKRSGLFDVIGNIDTHNLSPRQMTGLGQDLYIAGTISFEDYSLLAFQPELRPDFDRTIGALTGERADPDRPRDFVELWSERAAFERRHNPHRPDLIEQSERIASVLRQIESPTNVTA